MVIPSFCTTFLGSCVLVLAVCRSAAGGASWTYTGDHGQEHWPDSFPDCGGTSQSPINLKTWNAVHDGSLPPIQPVGYRTPDDSTFTLANNGHTVKLSLPSSMRLIGLPNNYTAAQLHLHWGSEEHPGGAEHYIDDQEYPAELHIVHYNSDAGKINDVKDKPNGLAVLGILIATGPRSNPGFANIINHLGRVSYAEQSVPIPSFNIEDLLPSNLDRYFRYSGSLTTPPCSQSVVWTVFSNPVQISESQMETLRTTLHSTPMNRPPAVLENNVRHIQPVNYRTVYVSFVMEKGLSAGKFLLFFITSSM
ncbi:PREDICTED: carbonic anhydrase 14 [Nanorana parkeri]|uniref:carbonic anhydrase 14 n=1 Tax=Nanorana parkeri TaxID=125878 RepID=UPI0008542400|nr:PREDICTED: carbonic anhydrase 14 [Nanorana parkeri]